MKKKYPLQTSVTNRIGLLLLLLFSFFKTSFSQVAIFTAPASQCFLTGGNTFNFDGSASTPSDSIISWKWNFGDGSPDSISLTSGLANHIYTTAGTFPVKLTVTKTGGATNSVTHNVTVDSTSLGGTATPTQSTICSGGSTTIKLTGSTGAIQWQESANGTSGWANVSGATTATYTTANLSSKNYYRAVVTSGVCISANSTISTVTVDSTSVGGTATATPSTICSGGSTTITLTGSTGAIQWQESANGTSGWANVSGAATTATYTTANLSAVNHYRAVVKSGVCPDAYSSTATVTVNPKQSGTVSIDQILCKNSTASPLNLTLTGGAGTPSYQWYSNANNSTSMGTLIFTNGTSSTYTPITTSPGTTYYYLTVTYTGSGCGTVTSNNTAKVTVDSTSVGGSVSAASQTICSGKIPANLTLNSNVGSVVKWQYSSSNFSSDSTDISNTTSTLALGSLTSTRYYRAIIKSGVCSSTASSTATVTVNPLPTASISVSSPSAVCKNAGSPTITFTGNSATPNYTFYYSLNNLNKLPISTTSGNVSVTLQAPTTVNDTLTYSLDSVKESSSVTCSQVVSGKVVVVIHPKPTMSFDINTVGQCVNTNNYIFTNKSTISSGSLITNHSWAYGDGGTDITTNGLHKYSSAGVNTVTLISTTDKGCKDTLSKVVTVYPKPTMSFGINKVGQCVNANNYVFTNGSSVSPGSISSNSWAYGDGGTDATTNGSHTYLSASGYIVKLVSTTDKGCKDSISQNVTVYPKPAKPTLTSQPSYNVCPITQGHNYGVTTTSPLSGVNFKWYVNDDPSPVVSSKDINNQSFAILNFNSANPVIKVVDTIQTTGCKDSASFTITTHSPTTEDLKCNVFLYTATKNFVCTNNTAYQYQWGYDDLDLTYKTDLPGTINQQNYYLAGGGGDTTSKYYWVQTISSDGCYNKTYYRKPNGKGIAISPTVINSDIYLGISPNPSTNYVNVSWNKSIWNGDISITVTNGLGKLVMLKQVAKSSNEGIIKLSTQNLHKGLYIVTLSSKEGLKGTAKFIQQ